MRPLDITGMVFGRLTALHMTKRRQPSGRSVRLWKCLCECGNHTTVIQSSLRTGETTSCGCRLRDVGPDSIRYTHGHASKGNKSAEYRIWCGMKARCSNKNNKHYADYGGRGIAVCREWADSFSAFLAAMGPRPSPKHTVDRKNNDGNYEPGNCRWATAKEQAANRRRRKHFPIKILVDGEPIQDAARRHGLAPETVRRRYRVGVRGSRLFEKDLRDGAHNKRRKGIARPDLERDRITGRYSHKLTDGTVERR